MINLLKTAFLFVILVMLLQAGNSAKAQKAYDRIIYKAVIYGNPTTLQLADGYLLASKVTIRSKYGDQVFTTANNAPDNQGDLKFDIAKSTGKYKKSAGSWLTIKGVDVPEYPSRLKAVYWDGKVLKSFVFKKD